MPTAANRRRALLLASALITLAVGLFRVVNSPDSKIAVPHAAGTAPAESTVAQPAGQPSPAATNTSGRPNGQAVSRPPAPSKPPPGPVPSSLQRHSAYDADLLAVGLGDLWARDAKHVRILRLSADGAERGVLEPARFVEGFQFRRRASDSQPTNESWASSAAWLADDGTGVWIAGRTDTAVVRTRAALGCPSIRRTGPDRRGAGVLIRFDGRTMCPARVIDFTVDDDGWTHDGRELIPDAVAWSKGWLWAGIGYSAYQVVAQTGEIRGGPGLAIFGAGFGSIWATSPSSGGSMESVGVYRLDPVTQQSVLIGGGTFFVDCSTTRFEVVCLGYEPDFWWHDPGPGRTHTLERSNGGCCNQAGGARASSRDHIFRSAHQGSAIRIWETRSGTEIAPMHGPFQSIRKMAELQDVLWVSSPGGLYWVSVA